MSIYFLDTSALVKRYHYEAGSRLVDQLWNDPRRELVITRLAQTEWHSAISIKTRTGQMSAQQSEQLKRHFAYDMVNKRPRVLRILVRHFRQADSLLNKYALHDGLRTLDALQLAVAMELLHRNQLDLFVAADERLLQVATAEGLPTLNPASSEASK